MSVRDTTPSGARPRPVVLYGAFTASVGAFLGFAGLADLMPKTVIAWVALVAAVATAGGAVLVQSTTTPLSSPQDARGVPLVPLDSVPQTPPPVVSAGPVVSPPITESGQALGLKWTGPNPRPDA